MAQVVALWKTSAPIFLIPSPKVTVCRPLQPQKTIGEIESMVPGRLMERMLLQSPKATTPIVWNPSGRLSGVASSVSYWKA